MGGDTEFTRGVHVIFACCLQFRIVSRRIDFFLPSQGLMECYIYPPTSSPSSRLYLQTQRGQAARERAPVHGAHGLREAHRLLHHLALRSGPTRTRRSQARGQQGGRRRR